MSGPRLTTRLQDCARSCERRRGSAARVGGRRAADMGDSFGLTHCSLLTMEAVTATIERTGSAATGGIPRASANFGLTW